MCKMIWFYILTSASWTNLIIWMFRAKLHLENMSQREREREKKLILGFYAPALTEQFACHNGFEARYMTVWFPQTSRHCFFSFFFKKKEKRKEKSWWGRQKPFCCPLCICSPLFFSSEQSLWRLLWAREGWDVNRGSCSVLLWSSNDTRRAAWNLFTCLMCARH